MGQKAENGGGKLGRFRMYKIATKTKKLFVNNGMQKLIGHQHGSVQQIYFFG